MLKKSLYLILFFATSNCFSQITIVGRVLDSKTLEPLSYMYVYTSDNSAVTQSDFEGNYSLTLPKFYDSLKCSSTGYNEVTKVLSKSKNQIVDFHLISEGTTIEKVIVKKGVNPAIRIIKGVQANKKKYNYDRLESYQYKSYTKVTFAVNNITKKLQKKKFVKKISGLFDTISYLSEDSKKAVLPVFLSESLSEYYYNKSPRKDKEIIIASKIKGVGVQDGILLSQLLGSTFQQYNFYANQLVILDKTFLSPVADNALRFYKYKVIDVKVNSNGLNTYEIKVKPKNPLDLAFNGTIWIEDSTFALKKLVLSIPKKSNLNFIENLKISMELVRLSNGIYFPSKSRVLIDVDELSKNSAGMVAIFASSFKEIIPNQPKELKFYDYLVKTNEDAFVKEDSFWDNERHVKLSRSEIKVLDKIDSLTHIKIIRNYVKAVDIITSGWIKMGKFYFGQYSEFIGYNQLEGFKSQLSLRTNFKFSKRMILLGQMGYGFKDKLFKYRGMGEFILNRRRWTTIGIEHSNKVEQMGFAKVAFEGSSSFSDFSQISNDQLFREKMIKSWFQSEFRKGWQVRLEGQNFRQVYKPLGEFNYAYLSNASDTMSKHSTLNNTQISTTIRFSPKEYYLQNDNYRIPLKRGSNYTIALTHTKGFKDILNGGFNFDRLKLKVNIFKNVGYFGYSKIQIEGLQNFGTLPYSLLNIHKGNETFFYSKNNYNQMNFLEFASDKNASFWWEHHFEGMLLNRIPLLKKLKWRSFMGCKVLTGLYSKESSQLIPNYDSDGFAVTKINSLDQKPYIEVGYGFENIFKIIRIDFVHRLTYLDVPYKINKFGIYGGFSFSF